MEVDRNRLADIDLTENARAVLGKRYLKKNEKGEPIEEPIEMFLRVASNIAEGEFRFKEGEEAQRLYEESRERFLQIMLSRRFMPNSPTLMNAGRELQQLSACFVLPVEDSIDGIYDTLKHQAVIHKSGGGTGFGFSRLRPKNDLVKSTMGVSSGPVSFMAIYDASTDKIKQGGTRRGANMGILRVDHPDIEEFIDCKRDNDQINNFNISVAITDEFMEAVESDTDFELKNPRDGEVIKTVRARDLFRKIVEGAWLNGEPGVVFIDKINDDNPTPQFPIESTNPCSEAHLPPYDSCNLGSINLERFYREDTGDVDWDDLRETVHTAIRFLDNVIEQNNYPLSEIDEMSRGNRRIGLGVMGFADLLIKLGITYDSEEGLAFAERMMKFVDDEAWEESRALAEERGVMPNYEGSRHEARGDRVRNATVTTIAPTGTISMIAGCSGGIEPLFAVAFMRRQADMEMPDVNPEFVKLAKERGFYSEELMKKVAEHGSVRDVEEVPDDVRSVWVTSHDISSEWHVRMQAAFQKYTSMGISKTINLPNEATPEDVEDAYRQAYALNCKGIAVYRDGSRDAQVLSTGKTGGEKPTMTPASPEAPTAPPVTPPARHAGPDAELLLARRGAQREAAHPDRRDQEDTYRPRLDVRNDERRRVRAQGVLCHTGQARRYGRRVLGRAGAYDHHGPYPRRHARRGGPPAPRHPGRPPCGRRTERRPLRPRRCGEGHVRELPDRGQPAGHPRAPDHRGLPRLRQRPYPPGGLRRLPLLRVLEV